MGFFYYQDSISGKTGVFFLLNKVSVEARTKITNLHYLTTPHFSQPMRVYGNGEVTKNQELDNFSSTSLANKVSSTFNTTVCDAIHAADNRVRWRKIVQEKIIHTTTLSIEDKRRKDED